MQSTTSALSVVKLNRNGKPSRLLKRSKIWEVYWIVPDDPSKAVCKECQGVISRGGGTGKSQCTTNLWKHLQNRHPKLFQELGKYKEVVHRSQDSMKLTPRISGGISHQPEKSKVWELFAVNPADPTIAKCLECGTEVNKQHNDTCPDILWYHVMSAHPETYTTCVAEAIQVVVTASGNKRSDVWHDFTQHPGDCCKVVCNSCDAIVSRGTSKERLNTTNMRRHLTGSVHLNALRIKGLLQDQDSMQGSNSDHKDANYGTHKAVTNGVTDKEPNHHTFQSKYPSSVPDGADVSSGCSAIHQPDSLNLSSIIMDRQVDLVHTGLLGKALYEQQKQGICCDFSIIVRYKAPAPLSVRRKVALDNNDDKYLHPMIECADEFQIHRCVAVLMSEKLRSVVESGSGKLTLIDVNKDLIPSLIEIMYTGRLGEIGNLKRTQLQEIYDLAELLSAPTVIEYMKRTQPRLAMRSNIAPIAAPSSLQGGMELTLQGPPMAGAPLETDVVDNNSSTLSDNLDVTTSPETPTNIPKVNKRKNYMPVSNTICRKMAKLEDQLAIPDNVNERMQNRSPDVDPCSDIE